MTKAHTCPKCDGTKRVEDATCPTCDGKGVVYEPASGPEEAAPVTPDSALDLTYRPDR